MENQGRAFSISAWAVFLGAFAWALLGLNPSFFLDDSPETVTACVTLGIPHPPGYPLHTLLGHLPTLLPVGSLGFRVNLSSAFLGAAICLVLFLFLTKKVGLSRPASILFSLLWILGQTAYPAALSAKTGVYELTALLLLGILWCLREGKLFPVAFLLGLGFANHWMTMVALLPGIALLALPYLRPEVPAEVEGTPKSHPAAKPLVLLSMFLLGVSLYCILPIRALLNPHLNWGNPVTWHNFTFDFLRSQYQGPEGTGGVSTWVRQFGVIVEKSFFEYMGLLGFALLGFWKLWTKEKALAQGLALLWLGVAGALAVYLNLSSERLYLIADYVLPAHLFILLTSAWGWKLQFSAEEGMERPRLEKAAYVLLAVLTLFLGSTRWAQARQTDYTYSYDFLLNSFKPLPPGAFYYCKGDTLVFPAWYFQWVEGKRRDIVVVGMDGIPMEWVRKGLYEDHPELKVPRTVQLLGTESIPALCNWILQKNSTRALYVSFNKLEDGSLPGVQIQVYGVVGKGVTFGASEPFDEAKSDYLWDHLRLRHLGEPGFPLDERTRSLTYRDYAVFRNTLGLYYEDKGDNAKAALTVHSKVGDVEAMQADYGRSWDHYHWAQTWVPEDPQFNFNLGNACYHKGKLDDSLKYYDQAIQLDPRYTAAYGNAAIAALQLNQYTKAWDYFKKVLDQKPDDAQAKKGLDYLKQIGQAPK
jgi:tetratricopeptide (TPR) repeat protein